MAGQFEGSNSRVGHNEPNLSSLCVQGIFQADSGITISLTGFPKIKSTKLLKRYKTIIHNHDSIFGP
jgi:hypothetical protein